MPKDGYTRVFNMTAKALGLTIPPSLRALDRLFGRTYTPAVEGQRP